MLYGNVSINAFANTRVPVDPLYDCGDFWSSRCFQASSSCAKWESRFTDAMRYIRIKVDQDFYALVAQRLCSIKRHSDSGILVTGVRTKAQWIVNYIKSVDDYDLLVLLQNESKLLAKVDEVAKLYVAGSTNPIGYSGLSQFRSNLKMALIDNEVQAAELDLLNESINKLCIPTSQLTLLLEEFGWTSEEFKAGKRVPPLDGSIIKAQFPGWTEGTAEQDGDDFLFTPTTKLKLGKWIRTGDAPE
jgi:hypothetical protein